MDETIERQCFACGSTEAIDEGSMSYRCASCGHTWTEVPERPSGE